MISSNWPEIGFTLSDRFCMKKKKKPGGAFVTHCEVFRFLTFLDHILNLSFLKSLINTLFKMFSKPSPLLINYGRH